MEPIPYFYDSINRNAIIVKPKKPFFNWLNATFPEDKPVSILEENNIYLIRQMDSISQIHRWINQNFDDLFVNELNDWHTDEKVWPRNRTFKMFSDWFDIEIHSVVLDLEESEITKE